MLDGNSRQGRFEYLPYLRIEELNLKLLLIIQYVLAGHLYLLPYFFPEFEPVEILI